ncbi:hypothetical protein AQUCO_00900947v1 [Aquilegia coerulea]|uniref:Uncharacterized protein n=1 Tax=Aquilegia coerulea TaxID=218851 RepID=A0A2G5EGM0_AQUCA|nr:hypothetical protein AQUCO_00900947v1 [Aquilegia coerulea]
MRRFLLKSATLYYTRHHHSLHTIKPISIKSSLLSFSSFQSNYKFFSSDNESSSKHLNLTSKTSTNLTDIEDVSTKGNFF